MNEYLLQRSMAWAGLTGTLIGAIEVALMEFKHNSTEQAVATLRDVLRRAHETREGLSS